MSGRSWMMGVVVWVVGLMLAVESAGADDLVITSFSGNGEVTWTYPTNGVREYRVEWCSDLTEGLWCDLAGGLHGIMPTGMTMRASVPMFYRIKAYGPEPTNMVHIPAGWSDMGNGMDPGEGFVGELPVHSVYAGGFYMDKYEVSSNLWGEVRTYALARGYGFDNTGQAKGPEHPVRTVNWYDCVKWANARSQKEGWEPCYTNADGSIHVTGTFAGGCDWSANGYRLPTEAEWEKAARGGVSGRRFPWADDTIRHALANYYASSATYSYDTSPTSSHHPDYDDQPEPFTSPVGAFAPNGYGLCDMAGNVEEWCWDWYDVDYYASSPQTNPRGPASGPNRVARGCSWSETAKGCRVACRFQELPTFANGSVGFRLVRSAP
ncbi:MAG: SUMF1/EgtB/PvdO family nonheme iron enzyme [Verrucomicrobia bacterium]|jgi:formylglycine-generating enzyme|nr:SUMF1/EgtB/PvdO family nonheme iron enzyme [Verrucomicrobiota bacterium]MBT7067027.1 SUMF1/EgtB/PvdO family nonheme iron enzyme [Verrucomicrobiota bacterium]MBT7702367.1 SUMF1/EgtB/PvdO family nonheme iron enzyme [Verrucomicrobiota bacterium]